MLPPPLRRVLAALLTSLTIATAFSAVTTTTAHAAPSSSCANEKAARDDARVVRTDAVNARRDAYQAWSDARATYQADPTPANRQAKEDARATLDTATGNRTEARIAFRDARTALTSCLNPYRLLFTDRFYFPDNVAGASITIAGLRPGQDVYIEVPDFCGEGCGDSFTADDSGAATAYSYGITSCPATRQPRVRVYDGFDTSGPLLKEQVLTADVCSDEWAFGSGESDVR